SGSPLGGDVYDENAELLHSTRAIGDRKAIVQPVAKLWGVAYMPLEQNGCRLTRSQYLFVSGFNLPGKVTCNFA
ncbi:MAG TPA: hypothetical protein VNO32_16245, partial [Candidatus Acidoferrum sp.]|nr:hypothetical protein [Candidatus Acidoferrum sp.]